MLAIDTTDSNKVKVYVAPWVAGNTAFTWSASTLTHTTGSSTMQTNFCASSDYVFSGEYGDPTGGPHIYRSADGTTWETVFGPDATVRHIHAMGVDPYTGYIWACIGDGTIKTVIRSTQSGASGTFEVVVQSSAWQGVQISFTQKHVFIAGDSIRGTVIIIDKATLTPKWASKNWHANIPVPGAAVTALNTAGDTFYKNAYMGAVDPDTGIYYCIAQDTSAGGTRYGFFYLPYPGSDVILIDSLPSPTQVGGEVFIHDGYVWFGQYRHLLLTMD